MTPLAHRQTVRIEQLDVPSQLSPSLGIDDLFAFTYHSEVNTDAQWDGCG